MRWRSSPAARSAPLTPRGRTCTAGRCLTSWASRFSSTACASSSTDATSATSRRSGACHASVRLLAPSSHALLVLTRHANAVWGFASAVLAAVLVARDPLVRAPPRFSLRFVRSANPSLPLQTLVRLALGAVCSTGAVVLAHALLKPLPESGGAWPRLSHLRSAHAAALRNAPRRGLVAPDADPAVVCRRDSRGTQRCLARLSAGSTCMRCDAIRVSFIPSNDVTDHVCACVRPAVASECARADDCVCSGRMALTSSACARVAAEMAAAARRPTCTWRTGPTAAAPEAAAATSTSCQRAAAGCLQHPRRTRAATPRCG